MQGIPADLQRFFVPVDLDRRRTLAFDNRATFLIYQRFGSGFWHELYERDPENPNQFRLRSHTAFEYFLWAGLQRDADAAGEVLTLEQVSRLILPTSIGELAQALLVALSATHKRPDKSKNE
jgi:hypothetical protein